jgi:CheY-like chemotaxis protein
MVAKETKLGYEARKFILIVEDDHDVAASVADVLEGEGYRTAVACNGREALDELLRKNHPDVILLDMMMPVMDGWQFREAQMKLPEAAAIPVITVTADGDARAKAASIGAAGHLAKPVTIEKLVEIVERTCRTPDG